MTCERDSLCVLAEGHYGPHQYASLEDAEAAATFTEEDRERMRLENRVRDLEAAISQVADDLNHTGAIPVGKVGIRIRLLQERLRAALKGGA